MLLILRKKYDDYINIFSLEITIEEMFGMTQAYFSQKKKTSESLKGIEPMTLITSQTLNPLSYRNSRRERVTYFGS